MVAVVGREWRDEGEELQLQPFSSEGWVWEEGTEP